MPSRHFRYPLSNLQKLLLIMIERAGDEVYGAALTRAFARCGRDTTSSIYNSLRSLESRGYLVSRLGDREARGGKPKRFYRLISKMADPNPTSGRLGATHHEKVIGSGFSAG